MAQDVAGLGAYTMWDQHLYFAGTLYRSGHIGSTFQPPTGQGSGFNIRGVAPYWRVAWQQNGVKNNFEVGTYGMHMNSTPGAVVGPEDTYTDAGGLGSPASARRLRAAICAALKTKISGSSVAAGTASSGVENSAEEVNSSEMVLLSRAPSRP